jgi:hypothetical protein
MAPKSSGGRSMGIWQNQPQWPIVVVVEYYTLEQPHFVLAANQGRQFRQIVIGQDQHDSRPIHVLVIARWSRDRVSTNMFRIQSDYLSTQYNNVIPQQCDHRKVLKTKISVPYD